MVTTSAYKVLTELRSKGGQHSFKNLIVADLSFACFKDLSNKESTGIDVEYVDVKAIGGQPFEIFAEEEFNSITTRKTVGIRAKVSLKEIWKVIAYEKESEGKLVDFIQLASITVYDVMSHIVIIDRRYPVGFERDGNNLKRIYPPNDQNLSFRFYETIDNHVRADEWRIL